MTAIDRPCPSCRSNNVKWRRRRWYDALLGLPVSVLTYLGPSRSTDGVSYATSTSSPNMLSFLHGQQLTKHAHITHAHRPETDRKIDTMTVQLLYRCRDCGSHGKHAEKRTLRPPSF
jgi:hypothetical protein